MNHHIRNALQIIRYAGYRQPEARQTMEIEDAVKRIDWALREVLPGNVTTYDEGWKTRSAGAPPDGTGVTIPKVG
jgi:hypothetical protein